MDTEPNHTPFVWVGSLKTGDIRKRAPKNLSIVPGLYDGRGAFRAEDNRTIEAHLGTIESEASMATREFAGRSIGEGVAIPAAISRFLAWQAARSPGWMELEQDWVRQLDPHDETGVVEPPPEGFERIEGRERPMCIENPKTGSRREVTGEEELRSYLKNGWTWVLRRDDHLEMLHLQAWYFQVRHFPRLSWVRLQPPANEYFITSDRGVAWLVDGYANTPPAALRDPAAVLLAPLTKTLALVGRNQTRLLNVTPREFNCSVAAAASDWIAGPTFDVVQQALNDCWRDRIVF